MIRTVVDASVAFKWFRAEEEDSVAEALALLEEHAAGKRELWAPSIMPYEVLNGLRSAGIGAEMLDGAARALAAGEMVFAPAEALLESSVAAASAYGITVYDAGYVALARMLDCTLVTADEKAFASLTDVRVRLLVS